MCITNQIKQCINKRKNNQCIKSLAANDVIMYSLRWRHNELDGVSDHQPHDCLLNLLFRRRSKKTSKLRVTGLCAGNSPWTGEFPAQKASNAENVSIWWRHHVIDLYQYWFMWWLTESSHYLNQFTPIANKNPRTHHNTFSGDMLITILIKNGR